MDIVDTKCPAAERRCFEVRVGHDSGRVFTSTEHRAEKAFFQAFGIRRTKHEPEISDRGKDIKPREGFVKSPVARKVTNTRPTPKPTEIKES